VTDANSSQSVVRPAIPVVVRHGETAWNAGGQWQGWLDSPLTERGIQQARMAAEEIASLPVSAVFSSDAGRALDTARLIATHHGIEARAVVALRERNYGDYEGLTSAEIDVRFPGSRFELGRGETRETWRPPAGESMDEVRARLVPYLQELAETHAGKTVVLVTHSGIVRVLDGLARRQSLDEIWDRKPPNCCVYVVELRPGPELLVLKDFEPALD
jgi:broad specificity phosphatase PhoE